MILFITFERFVYYLVLPVVAVSQFCFLDRAGSTMAFASLVIRVRTEGSEVDRFDV